MKKKVLISVAMVAALSLTACGSLQDAAQSLVSSALDEVTTAVAEGAQEAVNGLVSSTDSTSTANGSTDEVTAGAVTYGGMTMTQEENTLYFTIDAKDEITSSGWLGLCTEGYYLYERDADDVDFDYSYPNNYYDEEGNILHNTTYTYTLTIYEEVEPGDYTLVFCNDDSDGYVIAEWPIKIKANGTAVVDYDGVIINEMPKGNE